MNENNNEVNINEQKPLMLLFKESIRRMIIYVIITFFGVCFPFFWSDWSLGEFDFDFDLILDYISYMYVSFQINFRIYVLFYLPLIGILCAIKKLSNIIRVKILKIFMNIVNPITIGVVFFIIYLVRVIFICE